MIHSITVGAIACQFVESSPDDRCLSRYRQATPVDGSFEIGTDAARNEAIFIHELNQTVGRAPGSVDEVFTIGDTTNSDQTLHRISDRVQERLAGVTKAAIAEPAIADLFGQTKFGVANSPVDRSVKQVRNGWFSDCCL